MTQLVNAAFDRHAMQRVSGWLARAGLLVVDFGFAHCGTLLLGSGKYCDAGHPCPNVARAD
jgi:hypothetical protein